MQYSQHHLFKKQFAAIPCEHGYGFKTKASVFAP